jgi:predicted nucleic acid-binding protein/predicted CopG family antitoxin
MARSVHLSEDAYDTLTALKGEDESYSDVVLRLAGERRDPTALLDLPPLREGFDLDEVRARALEADRDKLPNPGADPESGEGDQVAVVADTSFLVVVAEGDEEARRTVRDLAEAGEFVLIPSVVAAEYLTGSTRPDAALDRLRAAGDLADFTVPDARAAAEVARRSLEDGSFPGWTDALIAGFARNRGDVPVLTADPDGFPGVETRTYRDGG